jgi:hypothetical protein
LRSLVHHKLTINHSAARIRRLGITGLQYDDYFVAVGGVAYTMLCVAFNQMLSGGGSNLLTDEDIAALTPESTRERVIGSKWVFASEHAMLITIWSMKAAMLALYARITSGTNVVQRRLLKGVAVWVGLAFIGDELALFLICRPVSQYWAVPAANGRWSVRIFGIGTNDFASAMLNLRVLSVCERSI